MNKVFIFALGAAAGSLLTWKLLEKKYKQIADEEIASVKQVYKARYEGDHFAGFTQNDVIYESKKPDPTADVRIAYYKQITDYSNDEAVIEVEQGEDRIEPYVITPEEYGDKEGYETRSLTYYADKILADEQEMIIGDPGSIIGDALDHFGEYADYAVYVRDENNECDYEILKHDETFADVNGVNI